MQNFIPGIFFILHGLVHLLYFGHSKGYFDLKPNLRWPAESWAIAKLPRSMRIKLLVGILCILAATGFVAGGIAFFINWFWWGTIVVSSALFSALIFILCWNGKMHKLHDQGGIGILIDIGIMIAVFMLSGFGT